MTDRVHALTVVLEHDMRDDDVQALIDAIRCMRFVAGVSTHVAELADYSARAHVRTQLYAKLHEALGEILYPKKETT